jgi:quinoprotein glucose dehydrogenase
LIFLGGSRDKKFQAYDKETGALLWETTFTGAASSTPASFMSKGKQYIAVSVAGNKESPSGFIVALALPDQ